MCSAQKSKLVTLELKNRPFAVVSKDVFSGSFGCRRIRE
ncbi:hypothetical protein LEP1GSC047_3457 [Leptospira inadai serovar Lyme str. 10]|uniref:Uncharacterized protein n=1 Tax=Leptospira inadai serovar Lyme str. 10 TaxID=1049790 RepID=V6HBY3_9LEPT|nr:hypothetical protein LEP1GSC047_3457 [Leptospira inadai serovar Lyme str. 10]